MDIHNENFHQAEVRPWGMEENQFCALMHIAQFASYVVPVAGIALPIIMWALNKDQSEKIDVQGKHIVNWIISSYLYYIIFGLLSIVLIGIPFVIAVGILSVVCAIIGAVKSREGEVYEYPFTIDFIK
ncbi:DUF4870 domain-containing protein [Flammeovirga yaeyamensis]|uniref:DUF4870 domain-containing protein n=1 Tax=Flammeovirga yaeyamensis TaxID=367791 RepID=A0AAX1NAY4_9BACT|nr:MULTISPECIES: DUF4870 domain-containing protein [Flammeovirga]ANQ52338.1 DUF4870 domain-containing protein [Flammeovirga sp. MY04]MBB3699971.1 hypothetical protein [Flammeovirga yaeyamensis]NMF37590.1 DUF4870 domain-containing protein [Flammeovirga yaeyamensis]QWG04647.1 DUF4870 domain-containing protein [Flammeovirga yaeyamensis]